MLPNSIKQKPFLQNNSFLKKNPIVLLQIRIYTDNRHDKTAELNQKEGGFITC
jgi:hypothetical protein